MIRSNHKISGSLPIVVTLLLVGLYLLPVSPAQAALVPAEHPLFSEDAVHEIHLTFSQSNWWDLLVDNFEGLEDPLYLSAEFDWAGTHFDAIGVRFKGNSSYNSYPGVKKSFKLDIDEYVEGQEIEGLDKLNLNNCFMDPSFVRERCAYELCEATGAPTVRTNYAALYINGSYWGLYVLVEQADQEFIESRFGSTDNGNLWKGDPKGTMEYLGSNQSSYYNSYELENHEDENDWSALVELTDRINNTPSSQLVDSLHVVLDANSAMAMLAVDLFTVNLDSYIGRCCNYYAYHRDLDGRMVIFNWDVNEAWGVFNMWHYSTTQLKQLSPFWSNPQYGENRPLAQELWAIPAYEEIYLGHIKNLMATAADPDFLISRMESMRDLIRPYVYDDPNKMFTNSQFDVALSSDITTGGGPGRTIPGLEPMIRGRHSWLEGEIGSWTPVEGLVLNEVMSRNSSTLADNAGDFDDWIEITNTSGVAIELGDFTLVDHHDGTPTFEFPSYTLQPGEYIVIWADEEPGEGIWHAPFKLDGDGEDLFLVDNGVIIDQVTLPSLATDQSYGRWADGTGAWIQLAQATPGAENENTETPEDVDLYINEFVALNNSGISDEMGSFEDWVEIYNPGPDDVAMGGLFLTDDLAATTTWAFPDVTLMAGEFLVVWCDDDPSDGPLHATFKLSGAGEEIGLFGRLAAGNTMIDSYTFGAQTADISEGRLSDGGSTWVFFNEPTPGTTNGSSGIDESLRVARSVNLWPAPFAGNKLTIQLTSSNCLLQDVSIFDLQGRNVRSLLKQNYTGDSLYLDWDGRSDAGLPVGDGVFFLRATWDEGSIRRKFIVVR